MNRDEHEVELNLYLSAPDRKVDKGVKCCVMDKFSERRKNLTIVIVIAIGLLIGLFIKRVPLGLLIGVVLGIMAFGLTSKRK